MTLTTPTSTLFPYTTLFRSSLNKIHTALLQLGETISDTRRMFGAKEDQVDPVRHLIATALVWGGLPEKDALDRKSTRLNSSHTVISYAVFCLKKKKNILTSH